MPAERGHMSETGRARRRVGGAILLVALAAWTMLLAGGGWLNLPAHCLSSARLIAPGWAGLELALILNPPAALAAAWAVMLVAMMAPLLERPIAHLWRRSGVGRRPMAIALFLLGYGAIWMAVGVALLILAIALRAFVPAPGAVLLVALVALGWQVSPWKRTCLNRCRARARLAPAGLAADRDALGYGLTHGLWCAGACWALMAIPLAIEAGHLAAMALVSLLLLAERLERPRRVAPGGMRPMAQPARS